MLAYNYYINKTTEWSLVQQMTKIFARWPALAPRSQLIDRAKLEEKRRSRRISGPNGDIKVFLGGSCNPTTWRHDTAIPVLKEHGITFYNPQVSNWKPELMEIEDQAKQTAEYLLFVIDNLTRSTASMVEAAYLSGCNRQLILVIKSFPQPGCKVSDEYISKLEYEDLERSHLYLTDLVERQGIPVFSDLHLALKCTCKSVKQNLKVSDLTVEDGASPVKHPQLRVANKLVKVKDVYNAVDTSNSGYLDFKDIYHAFKTLTGENLPASEFNLQNKYSFEDFCCLIAEFKHKRRTFLRRMMCSLSRLSNQIVDWFHGRRPDNNGEMDEIRPRDVFLGGTCGLSTWREDVAIPKLRKYGISYVNPQMSDWSTRYIPIEAALKDNCSILLYVITSDTRGITSMCEVGHYIGQGCNVVLCLEHLKKGVVIQGEKLTDTAVKDYNRARAYLADLANRDGVPIFSNIEEAIDCIIGKLGHNVS